MSKLRDPSCQYSHFWDFYFLQALRSYDQIYDNVNNKRRTAQVRRVI